MCDGRGRSDGTVRRATPAGQPRERNLEAQGYAIEANHVSSDMAAKVQRPDAVPGRRQARGEVLKQARKRMKGENLEVPVWGAPSRDRQFPSAMRLSPHFLPLQVNCRAAVPFLPSPPASCALQATKVA